MAEPNDEKIGSLDISRGRRDAIKAGVGAAVAAMMNSSPASAAEGPMFKAGDISQAGWKNEANRISGNGPMDGPTRQLVEYVASVNESILTPSVRAAAGHCMLDGMSALIAGFESEPGRISARLARTIQSDLKSTVLGYGVVTSPELAAFANGCMLRHCDFNDLGPSGHTSDIISGILAVAEAFHVTGDQMLMGVALGYELVGALGRAGAGEGWDGLWEGPSTALVMGKLMGLDKDRLANAFSLSLVPHFPSNVTHIGHLSHWKGCHPAEAIKCATWATLLAKEGMTGPPQPFEARNGVFDHNGPFRRPLQLPYPGPNGKTFVERMGFKRYPAVGGTQPELELMPQIRAWTNWQDIESIYVEEPFGAWQESADPPKWDPRNRETADHSQPFVIARALIDGDIYLDTFTKEKIMDPVARSLMAKITIAPNPEMTAPAEGGTVGLARITIRRTKEPREKVFMTQVGSSYQTPMTHEELIAKFNRVCAFRSIPDSQRDQAREQLLNLGSIKDMAIPMRTLAKFGKPQPL